MNQETPDVVLCAPASDAKECQVVIWMRSTVGAERSGRVGRVRAGKKGRAAVTFESPDPPASKTHTQAAGRNNLKAAGKSGQTRRSTTRVTGT
ncbi:MAG: hypothetical protein KF691_05800 [Phycisphaeraceae bacterium]|nr:hypothetical protein [Phycisphaeraceae bacterium]